MYQAIASVCAIVVVALIVQFTTTDYNDRGTTEPDDRVSLSAPEIVGWYQVGKTLVGPTNQHSARFGFAVSISENGKRIAVGLPGLDSIDGDSIQSAGAVFIFDYSGSEWLQAGKIGGMGQGSQAGTCLKLSSMGNRLAVGAPGSSDNDGYVAVYEEAEGDNWVRIGNVIRGVRQGGNEFGSSLDLSADGTFLIAGAKFANKMQGGTQQDSVGSVDVFQLSDEVWWRVGETIYGDSPGDFFGWDVSLSQDGKRIAATGIGSQASRGVVKVFDFNQGWILAGEAILGEFKRENFGSSVALSADGKAVVVGATGFAAGGSMIDVGCARIYQWNTNDKSWGMSAFISGSQAFDRFGSSVAISSDGKTCAIGGPDNDSFGGTSTGHVQVLEQNDRGEWRAAGSALGSAVITGGQLGSSVALSGTGKRVISGAPISTFDGYRSEVGHVLVFNSKDSLNRGLP